MTVRLNRSLWLMSKYDIMAACQSDSNHMVTEQTTRAKKEMLLGLAAEDIKIALS